MQINLYNYNQNQILNKNLIINNLSLLNILKNLKPLSFILYGSYSKNTQNKNSDIDLMIIFKKNIFSNKNFNNLMINLKKNISKIFNKNIDLIVMIYQNKLQYFENNYDNDTNFIYNVYNDAQIIYGKSDKDIILESYKYSKF